MKCLGLLLAGWVPLTTLSGAGEVTGPAARTRPLAITVHAGPHERQASLVRGTIPPDRLDPAVQEILRDRPVSLVVTEHASAAAAAATFSPLPASAEAYRLADGTIQVTWFLARPIPAGGEARFELDARPPALDAPAPWTVATTPGKTITVSHGRDRPVLTYNAGPTMPPATQPNPNLIRGGYFHPVYSPAGALVTGDFSPFHPHHRGIFLAYVTTRWGDLAPDFWNIQTGTGRIVAAGTDPPVVGPITCRFGAQHRWEALRPSASGPQAEAALQERWEVELFDVPGSPIWLVDLTTTQQAQGQSLEVGPHRYGGMAYRSAEPSVRGPIDVLTAEGRHRLDGDQKPTRWVDLTGPSTAGSPNYAGILIADHPANPRYPTVARIHPITLPFFSFVPAHDATLVIRTEAPTRFRYRIMIHDGRPDPALNDRIAVDFIDPPVVTFD